jgi:hypothetical protein
MNNIELHFSKQKSILFILVCLLISIGLYYIVFYNKYTFLYKLSDDKQVVFIILSIPLILFCLYGACFQLYKLLIKKPALIITGEGIFDESSPLSVGFISRQEIMGIKEFHYKSSTCIIIMVKNPEIYLNQGFILKRLINKLNIVLCGSLIYINYVCFEKNRNQIVNYINSFLYKE